MKRESSARSASGAGPGASWPPQCVGVDHLDAGQVEPVEQMALGRVGEEQLDVGATEVGHQGVTAAGAVHPDRDVSAQPGSGQAQEHLGGVVHQQPDMGRALRVEKARDRSRPGRGIGDELAPGPRVLVGQQGRGVLVGSCEQQVPDRHAGSAARSRPRRRACSVGAAVLEVVPRGRGEVAVGLAVEVDADAAVDVHCRVRDPVAGVGGPELGRGDGLRGGKALGKPPGRLPHRERQEAGVDVSVGQALCDGLEGADRPVELLPGLGVLGGERDGALRDAELDGAGRDREQVDQASLRPSPPSTRRSAATRTPSSSTSPATSPSLRCCSPIVRPVASASTRKTAVPSGVVAGTRNIDATVAAGTRYFVPVST